MKHFNHSSTGSIREMFLSIGDVITEDLVQEVNMADSFGLMIDEVTDISLIEQLFCFIQYVDRAGCPTIHFLFTADLLKESDSADAATIVKVIKEKLLNLGIDISKLRSLARDGASVMTGKKNCVAALLRKEHPGIINIYCICHKLALACADTKTELKDIDLAQLTLIQLWKYFQNSPKRTAVYLKVQEGTKNLKLNESSRKMVAKRLKKACTTRWLSFQTVFDNYAAVLQTLSQLSEKDTAAYGLLKRMKKTRFLGTLYILKCILPPLSKLSKIFQTERTDAEFRYYGVTSLDSLMDSFYPNIEKDEKNEKVTEWNKIKYNMLEWKKDDNR
ncbi:zinc finger MYM-type protein 1-like [Mytilus trossulus]|uniref:zinc finger MYM-type protein 1-like n=1 Tax=Mytilus trossulus TaxID=6551 RepID=UPI0030041F01